MLIKIHNGEADTVFSAIKRLNLVIDTCKPKL